MSYSMSLSEQKFSIVADRIEEVYKVLSIKLKLTEERYAQKDAGYKYLPPALKVQRLTKKAGFEFIPNKDETAIEKVGWHGLGMLGSEEPFLKIMARFVTPGSFIEMTGEDGCQWRYIFDGKSVKKIYPKIIWEE